MNQAGQEFWQRQAEQYGESPLASWGDHFAIALEVENISQHVTEGTRVLDAGCANGHATVQLLDKKPAEIVGIDFAPAMIEAANRRKAALPGDAPISFEVGDITNLHFRDASFDLVFTTRVLINLLTWQEQVRGIEECIRVTRPGGRIVFSEAFWEPLVRLNSLRALVQLPPLEEHDFNRYLKKTRLTCWLQSRNLTFDFVDFSSVYYLGSRFLREQVTNPADYPGYSNPVNEAFYHLEREFSGGGFGIQQACIVFR